MNPESPIFVATLLPLVAAHLAADFVLQTSEDVAEKHRPYILLKHAVMVGALSYVLLGVPQAWIPAAAVFGSHLAIDYAKIRLGRDDLKAFSIDQAAHLVAIALIAIFAGRHAAESFWMRYAGSDYYALLVLASAIVAAIPMGAIVVGKAVAPFLEKLERTRADGFGAGTAPEGFEQGGRLIGQLERALILLFVLMNQITAIGFLIAAKSILRFGEVKDRGNRMEAEYIIIGTLISFLWGLVIAYMARHVLLALGG